MTFTRYNIAEKLERIDISYILKYAYYANFIYFIYEFYMKKIILIKLNAVLRIQQDRHRTYCQETPFTTIQSS